MPGFYTYGVHAFLQLCGSSFTGTSAGTVVVESPSTSKWSPTEGMTHPILTTTIVSPARASPQPSLPFRIVVDFSPEIRSPSRPSPGPDPLRGDVRIELKIDGVVRGWRVLPQTKIWPKGIRVEFSGSRVGRTEERAFVFAQLPSTTENNNQPIHAHLPSPPTSALNSPLLDDEDPTLAPHTPSDLPLNASHIQILITLGKKHNTLEKYLISSPVLQEAFYVPPRLAHSPYENFEGDIPNIARGIKRKAGTTLPRLKKKETKTGAFRGRSHTPFALTKSEEPSEAQESASVDMSEATEWKPIGLARTSQKTAQMREAEFTATMHLARFWFFVVPDPACQSSPTISYVQQTTKQDEALVKSKAKISGREQGQVYEKSDIKLEGSDTGEREGQGGVFRSMKDKKIGELVSGSSQTEEEDSEGTPFETRYRTARRTIKTISHFINPAGDLMDPTNLGRSKWTTKNLIGGGNTKDTHGIDVQEPEKSNGWRGPEGSDGGVVRSGVTSAGRGWTVRLMNSTEEK